ncbi:MBL fold metallo-hydrolase [Nocardioides sp. zg-536]|uniref:MBL fold metallo-hydrolase n=1 Tax=Nocardioides faecalis TaxID=2803858 RepID=A0A939BZ27_9ACTN|nr:MBL fold metallo-hydrolase [Nocardioides faecalis]MBM9460903.1 MBL fold metallo-hydrolase [Nocardioides faecalis]QVI59272.1 MBL fold metallo-hydrolase [Nocardioides faecalis]
MELHWLRVGHCVQVEALARRGGRVRLIEFPSYAAAIRHPDRPELGWTLFDTGYATHFLDATERLPERLYRTLLPVTLPEHERLPVQLAGLGIDPLDVRRVVLSHFHGDHVAGLRDHPNAQVLAGGAGLAQVRRLGRIGALRHGLLPGLLPEDVAARFRAVEELPGVDLAVSPTGTGWDLLGDRSLLVVPLPGHMPGHLGLLLTATDGRQVLLAGDAAWSTRAITEPAPPSRLVGAGFDDWTAALGTLGHLHRLHRAHPELLVLPAHCDEAAAAWSGSGEPRP